MIVFVFVVVVAVVVGVAALALHGRSERGIESGISSFRRELDALAPRGDSTPKPAERKPIITRDDDDDVRTVQIGERPPPRRPTPSIPPTGVPAPGTSGDKNDTGGDADDTEPPADGDDAPSVTPSTDDAPAADPEGSDDGA